MSDSSCDANAVVMLQAKLEDAATERAALLRKVKEAIAEARKFSDEMQVGFIGQRIVDIIERVLVSKAS
jgi:hypothetical protein